MRYALISDIHANLPALEAVLADIAGQAGVAYRGRQWVSVSCCQATTGP